MRVGHGAPEEIVLNPSPPGNRGVNMKESSRQREHKSEMRAFSEERHGGQCGWSKVRKTMARNDVRDLIRAQVGQGPGGHGKGYGLHSKVTRNHYMVTSREVT